MKAVKRTVSQIEWAPLSVPRERRLQTLAAAFCMALFVLGEFVCFGVFAALMIFGNIYIRTLCVLYLGYMYYDRCTADQGGKGAGVNWVRSFIVWKYFRDYFPVDLVKTVDLDPKRNYLFAAFPHGILCSGAFINFGTNYSKFKELFPGLRSKFLTLHMHFHVPFFRDLLYSLGLATATVNCLTTLLTATNDPKDPINSDGYTGNAVILVIGGAQEALNSRPRNYQLVLKSRRGFVRLAIQTGSPIVPVFSFGEVDLYDQPSNPPGSKLRRFQEAVKRKTGISPAIFIGRGFFQYSFGFIPKRKPVTTVVGAPIEVEQKDNPTTEQIEEYHEKFMKALIDLFETHKSKYITNSEDLHLTIE